MSLESKEIKDSVNSPNHYNTYHGFQVIDVVEQLNFCKGNAVKYILRSGLKGDEKEDLKKAIWYLNREIGKLEIKG